MCRLLTFALVGLLAAPAYALDLQRPLAEARHERWSPRDGLHSDTVRAIVGTRDGFLWLGTANGLVRYDGAAFVSFDRTTKPALPRGDVAALVEGEARLWVGLDGEGLHALSDRTAQLVAPTGAQPAAYVRALTVDDAGVLWIATAAGVLLKRPGQFTAERAPGLEGVNTRGLARDARGVVHAGTRAGLFRWERDRFVPLPPFPEGAASVRDLAFDRTGTLWFVVDGRGLWRFAPGGYRRFGASDGLPSDRVSVLLPDRDGSLWIGTVDHGPLRVRPDHGVERLPDEHPLGRSFVSALSLDDGGALWIGTTGQGLHRLRDDLFERHSLSGGAAEARVSAVAPVGRDDAWLAGAGGVVRRTSGQSTIFGAAQGLDVGANGLFVSRDGQVWAPTLKGLTRLDLRQGRFVPVPGFGKTRYALAEADDGLWIVNRGAERLQGDARTKVPLPRDTVSRPYLGPSGTLWLGGAGFLLERRGSLWIEHWFDRAGVDQVLALHEDAAGVLWIGCSDGGLRRRGRDGRFTVVGRAQGLPTSAVFAILEDDRERLWMSSPVGIIQIAKRDFDGASAGHDRLRAVVFGPDDEVHVRQQLETEGIAARGPDGRLWFATDRGALAIDPRRVALEPAPRSVVIEGVSVDGRQVDRNAPLDLRPGTRVVEFRYTAPFFGAPARLRFRHRLDGLERTWTDAGAVRGVTYAGLPAGSYRFLVQAGTADGRFEAEPDVVPLSVRPPFHRKPSFYAGAGLLLAALVLGLHRLRLRQQRARYEAVLDERGRIAREIHDNLSQGLVAVATQIQCAREVEPDRVERYLEEAEDAARQTLDEARRAVLALGPAAVKEGDLAGALGTVVRRMNGRRTAVTLHVHGTTYDLPPDRAREALRVGQEAIANAVKHAQATRVDVRLIRKAQGLTLIVSDDGRGFDLTTGSHLDGHHGLNNMRTRAQTLGGSLEVQSVVGRGTTVTLKFGTS